MLQLHTVFLAGYTVGGDFLLMQGSARFHIARIVKDYFNKDSYGELPIAKGSDLISIKHEQKQSWKKHEIPI